MAVPAVNFTSTTDLGSLGKEALRAIREGREKILRFYAALDQGRDDGAVTSALATKLGAADATEAGKVFDEIASLKGYVESVDPNTVGAAILQACAKFGI